MPSKVIPQFGEGWFIVMSHTKVLLEKTLILLPFQ